MENLCTSKIPRFRSQRFQELDGRRDGFCLTRGLNANDCAKEYTNLRLSLFDDLKVRENRIIIRLTCVIRDLISLHEPGVRLVAVSFH